MSTYLPRSYYEDSLRHLLGLIRQASVLSNPGPVVVVHGGHGYGKTALAECMARQARELGFAVHWLNHPDLAPRTHLAELLQQVQGLGQGAEVGRGLELSLEPLGLLLERFRAWGGRGRHLLVLDDVQSADILRTFVPLLGWSVLITTTQDILSEETGVRRIELDRMDRDTAHRLLRGIVEAVRSPTTADHDAILGIIERAQGVPSYLRILGMGLAADRPRSEVVGAVTVADVLSGLDAGACELARALSIVPPIGLPHSMVVQLTQMPDVVLWDARGALAERALLEGDKDTSWVLLDHVRLDLRRWLDEHPETGSGLRERLAAGLQRYLEQLRIEAGGQPSRPRQPIVERLIAHLLRDRWPADAPGAVAMARILLLAYDLVREQLLAEPQQVEIVLREVQRLGGDDRSSGTLSLERARLFYQMGDVGAATRNFSNAIRQFARHEEHQSEIEARLDLAWLYLDLGWKEKFAEELRAVRKTRRSAPHQALRARLHALEALDALSPAPTGPALHRLVEEVDEAVAALERVNEHAFAARIRYQIVEALSYLDRSDRLCSTGALLERVEHALAALGEDELTPTRARFLVIRAGLRRAFEDLDEAEHIFVEWRDRRGETGVMQARVELRIRRRWPGDLDQAETEVSVALDGFRDLHDEARVAELLLLKARVTLERFDDLDEAQEDLDDQQRERLRLAMQDLEHAEAGLAEPVARLDTTLCMAEIARLLGDLDRAERLYQSAEAGYLEQADARRRAEAASGRLYVLLARQGREAPEVQAQAHRVREIGVSSLSDLAVERAEHVLGALPRQSMSAGSVSSIDNYILILPAGLRRGWDDIEEIPVLVRRASRQDAREAEALELDATQLQRLHTAWLSWEGLARVVRWSSKDGEVMLALDVGDAQPANHRVWTWKELRLPLRRALALLQRVHREGVLHGAIGPETLWFGPGGAPRLFGFQVESASSDFSRGVARDIEALCRFALGLLLGRMVPVAQSEVVVALETLRPSLPPSVHDALVSVLLPRGARRLDAEELLHRLSDPMDLRQIDGLVRVAEVDRAFGALSSGKHVVLEGPRGYGCSALVLAVAEKLSLDRARKVVVYTNSRSGGDPLEPFSGLFGAVDWQRARKGWHEHSETLRARAFADLVLGALGTGIWLLLDDGPDVPWAPDTRQILRFVLDGPARGRGRGAVLWVRPGWDGQPPPAELFLHARLGRLQKDELEPIFRGVERILHERTHAVERLWACTQGIPMLVRAELQRWAQLGWVEWSAGDPGLRSRISPADVSLPARPPRLYGAVAPLPEGDDRQAIRVRELYQVLHLAWPHTQEDRLLGRLGWGATVVAPALEELRRLGLARVDGEGSERLWTPTGPEPWSSTAPGSQPDLVKRVARLLPADDVRGVTYEASLNPHRAAKAALRLAQVAWSRGEPGLTISRLSTALELARRPARGASPARRLELQDAIFRVWMLASLGDGRLGRLRQLWHELRSTANPSALVDELVLLIEAVLGRHYLKAGIQSQFKLEELRLYDGQLEGLRRVMTLDPEGVEALRAFLDAPVTHAGGSVGSGPTPEQAEDLWRRMDYALGMFAYGQGEFEASHEHFLASAWRRRDSAWEAGCLYSAAAALAETERLEEADALVKRALELLGRYRHPAYEAKAWWVQRLVDYRRGASPDPEPELLRTVRLCGELRIEGQIGLTEAAFAWRRASRGGARAEAQRDLQSARSWLQRAVACTRQVDATESRLLASALLMVVERDPRLELSSPSGVSAVLDQIQALAAQVVGPAGDFMGVETLGLLAQVAGPLDGGALSALRARLRSVCAPVLRRPSYRHRFDRRGMVISWKEALEALDFPGSLHDGALTLTEGLLLQVFDEAELRRFVGMFRGGALVAHLPGVGATLHGLASAFATLLLQQGLADETFFEALLEHRGGRRDMIAAFRVGWPF